MQSPPASPLLVALLLLIRVNEASEDEFRLLKDLRKTYDLMERPVADHRKPIRVNLRILLQQLVDVVGESALTHIQNYPIKPH
jgi:hypothetical protein